MNIFRPSAWKMRADPCRESRKIGRGFEPLQQPGEFPIRFLALLNEFLEYKEDGGCSPANLFRSEIHVENRWLLQE